MKPELINRNSWNGVVDNENIEAIFDRVNKTLSGKRYSFADISITGERCDLRTSQSMKSITLIAYGELDRWITVNDTWGSWTISYGDCVRFIGDQIQYSYETIQLGHKYMCVIRPEEEE